MKRLFLFGMLWSLLVSCAALVAAQVSINGSLRGRVTDSASAVVAGARVTLTNVDTNAVLTATSDNEGRYLFASVAPGRYQLAAEREGFKRTEHKGIIITVNEATVADVTLVVGAISDTVTVEAGASVVQSQSAEVSQLVNERRVRELPLNGKDFQKLVFLAPGTATVVGGGALGNPSVNGSRPSNNTYTADGITFNNEEFTQGLASSGGAAGFDNSSPNLVSTEAIREFRVITSNADATFGRGAGGQINIVTRQGTNDFHGSVYHFLRNDALDARDFFNTGPIFDEDGRSKTPPFKQHLYGGSFGGRLLRDRHFFFGNFEGFRQLRRNTSAVVVPNAALISQVPGDLGRFYRAFYIDRGLAPAQGNPAGLFSPLSTADRNTAIAAGFPAALFDGNTANGEAGTSLISTLAPRDITQDSFTVRTDHKITNRLNLSVRYLFAQPRLTSSAGLPVDVTQTRSRVQQGVAQVVYTLSPAQILEARGGALRSRLDTGLQGGLDERLANIGVSPQTGIQIGAFGTPLPFLFIAPEIINDIQTTPQAFVMHTLARGALTLRSGFDVRRNHNDFRFGFFEPPFYSFSGYTGATGILGAAPGQPQALSGFASATIFGGSGAAPTSARRKRSTTQEYFAQADWRLSPTVTLNLGLRYSYFGVYREADDFESNLYAVDSSGKIVADASPFAFGRRQNRLAPTSDDLSLYQPDRDNFQPRLGIAWDIAGRGRTVVRAGYGIFHDRIFSGQFDNNVTNPPFATSGAAFFTPFLLGQALPIIPDVPSIYAIDPAIRNPYTHQFNVAVEQALGREMSLTAAYVGSRARHLIRGLEPNGSGTVPQQLRPDPRFVDQRFITNYSSSRYDSLQITARGRFARGVDFVVAYTLARSLDDTSADTALSFTRIPSLINTGASAAPGFQGGGNLFVERPRAADYSYSVFDTRHTLAVSHLVDLPFGKGRRYWSNENSFVDALIGGYSLAGIFRFNTGEPVDVTLGTDVNDDGDSTTDRPALLRGSLNDLYARGGQARTQYFISQADALRLLGTPANVADPFATIPRNALRAPNVHFYDLSLIKRIQTSETTNLNLEINFFNLFNRANFAAPVSTLSSPLFGQVTGTRTGTNPRQLQLGVKLTF